MVDKFVKKSVLTLAYLRLYFSELLILVVKSIPLPLRNKEEGIRIKEEARQSKRYVNDKRM